MLRRYQSSIFLLFAVVDPQLMVKQKYTCFVRDLGDTSLLLPPN